MAFSAFRYIINYSQTKPVHKNRLIPFPPSLPLACQFRAFSELTVPPAPRPELSLSLGTHLIPHPNKVDKGGEDAFFVSTYNGGVIAVADGVSGWAEQDVDPALFSKELIGHVSTLVADREVNYDPRILIKKAHAATSSIGSATVLVAMLENNGILKIANIGDCGLRILRKGQIIFATSSQEHYFDCPYQLSSEAVSQTYQDAVVCSIEFLENDKIVMGSDGLFDNVFDQEIVSIMSKYNNVAVAARELALLANNHSVDSKFDSPYSLEARARGYDVPDWKKLLGMKLTGGKLDDITVIVGQNRSMASWFHHQNVNICIHLEPASIISYNPCISRLCINEVSSLNTEVYLNSGVRTTITMTISLFFYCLL